MAIERIINDTPYSRNDFVRLIADTVGAVVAENGVGANVQDIVDLWGDPEWKTPEVKHQMSIEMGKLSEGRKSPVLLKAEGHRGRYIVAPGYLRYGLTAAESLERSLLPDFIANGGFMTYTAIRESFDIAARKTGLKPLKPGRRPAGRHATLTLEERDRRSVYVSDEDSPDYNLRARLAEATMIHKTTRGHNLWQLRGDMLAAIPLEGRYVEIIIWHGLAVLAKRSRPPIEMRDLINTRNEEVDDAYHRIGLAYFTARKMLGLDHEDLLDHEFTRDVLAALAHGHPARSAWEEFVKTRKPDDRWTPKSRRPKAFYVKRWDRPEDWPAVVLALFEEGDPDTHKRARTDFHRQVCALYDMNPVGMSRGWITEYAKGPRLEHPLLRLFTTQTPRGAPEGGEEGS